MTWEHYSTFIYLIIPLWIIGMLLLYTKNKTSRLFSQVFVVSGLLLLMAFIILLWISLKRPPFRTLAETRLWYGFFMAFIGLILFYRWKFKWMLVYSYFLGMVFLIINYFKPETFDQTLMPALQSPWFIPHVIVYMFAYAILTAATIFAAKGIFLLYKKEGIGNTLAYADNLVYVGFAFLTFGLLFGALWAKEAWGHYWTWDPKETWAFITWLVYLLYIHYRHRHKQSDKIPLYLLVLAMAVVLICWLGINYLPVAQNSVHTYTM